jgi:CDP-glycerol glycerophosphotransferase (TagB/SpsB family)
VKTKKNNTFSNDQNLYATLIQEIGKSKLPNGKIISDIFNLKDIPFWEIFAPELAWRHLTTCMAATSLWDNFKILIKPYVLPLKQGYIKNKSKNGFEVKKINWDQSHVVLVLGFTNYMYRDVLDPVINELMRYDNMNVVVLIDSNNEYVNEIKNKNNKIEFFNISDEIKINFQNEIKEIKKLIKGISKEIILTGQLYKLFPKNIQITIALKKVFYLYLKCYLPIFIKQALIAKHIITNYRPKHILSPDVSDTRTRVYTLIAKKMGIPTLEVQFGLTGNEGVEWRFFSSDEVCVWGNDSKEALLLQGVENRSINVTGSPRHDMLSSSFQLNSNSIRKKFSLSFEKKVILLASTYADKTHEKYSPLNILDLMKTAIFNAAKLTPDVVLIVKPHTQENIEHTKKLIGNSSNIIVAERNSDIRELILMCDAFISFGSTATIDALIANKLIICPIFSGWPFSEKKY